MTLRHRLATALAAVLTGTAAAAVLLPAPAQAAACTDGSGYTVVVDPQQLGGGSSTTCVSGSGRERAAGLFGRAGVSMQYASNDPGFVCRVNGAPESAGCVQTSPSSAYWSLWWSTGNGTWKYASSGVGSQKIPEGGWVAWSWQGQSTRRDPGVTPSTPVAAAPEPTVRPTTKPTSGSGSTGGSTGSGQASPGPSASTTPSATPSPSTAAQKKAAKKKIQDQVEATASAQASAQAAAQDGTAKASSESDGGPGGLAWVAIVVLLALGISGGVVAWRRRASADL